MPELAEVETLRRGVQAEFAGRRIAGADLDGLRSVRRHPDPREFARRVEGRRITGTGRLGKYLTLSTDDRTVVVAHMGMSGQLLLSAPGEPSRRHTHVRLRFDDGGPDLAFVDPRTFGEMFATEPVNGALAELAHLGFDPLEDPQAGAKVAALVSGRPTRLKPLLMDQSRIAGIGNMYADEILFEAGLRPDRPAASLSAPEAAALHRAMRTVLTAAIRHRGSSLADEQYRDLYGRVGDYQKRHRVYGREGQPCPRCGAPVKRARSHGRSSFSCPECQK